MYHPGKENVVADALSLKILARTYGQFVDRRGITNYLCQLARVGIRRLESLEESVIVKNMEESLLIVEVKENREIDPILLQPNENVQHCMTNSFELMQDESSMSKQISCT